MEKTRKQKEEAGKEAGGQWGGKEEERLYLLGKQRVVANGREDLHAAMKVMNAVLAVDPVNEEAKKEKAHARSLLGQYHQLFKTVVEIVKAASLAASLPPSAPPPQDTKALLAALRAGMTGEGVGREGGREGGVSSLMQEVTTRPRVQPTETFRKIAVVEEGREGGYQEQQQQQQPAITPTKTTPFSPASSPPSSSPLKKLPSPPTRICELETHWKTLKNEDVFFSSPSSSSSSSSSSSRLASYLASFRPQTFPKVIKSVTSQEVVRDIYAVLAQQFCSEQEGEEGGEGGREGRREVVKRVLEGMATMEGFAMRMRMMEPDDWVNINKAFDYLAATDPSPAAAATAATTATGGAAASGGGGGGGGGSATKKGGKKEGKEGEKKAKASLTELRRKYLG